MYNFSPISSGDTVASLQTTLCIWGDQARTHLRAFWPCTLAT